MTASAQEQPHFLHLHSSFGTGGKELRCAQLINAFGADARHSIISGVPENMGAAKLISSEVDVNYPTDFPPLSGRPMPSRFRALAEAMQGYDLILTYNWGAMDAVMAHRLHAKSLELARLVHHEDGFNEDEQERLKTSRNLFRRLALAGRTDMMVPSHRLENIALDIWKQPRSHVRFIPNGIRTANFTSAPHADALPGLTKGEGEKWVGTLAGLRKVKDVPLLVRAFSKLPEPWKLVIVGEGPERDAILQQAQQCGVAERVHLPGFAANPASYVGLFDIFALSSKSEQFPISVVEAMAASLPIAAPDVGDIAHMIAGTNRRFIGPPNALADNLMQLAQDQSLREKIGIANQRKAQAEFDEAPMISAYRSLYSLS